jgi:hypothetical protein
MSLSADPLTTTANLMLAAAALGCLTFAVLYTARSAWRTTALGRHMFYFGWAIVLAYLIGVLRTGFPDQDWLAWAVVISRAAVAGVFWQRVYLLWRSLHSDREED